MNYIDIVPPHGPYSLDRDTIERSGILPLSGAYVLLGRGLFPRIYVGRSDGSLPDRLRRQAVERGKNKLGHIGLESYLSTGFSEFWFWYTLGPAHAYQVECELYHYFLRSPMLGILQNYVHPDSPAGYSMSCPVCGLPANTSSER